jgi:hypothetical protein
MVIMMTKAVATVIHAVSPLLGTGAGAASGAASGAAMAAGAAAAGAGAVSAKTAAEPMSKLNPSAREANKFFMITSF